MSDYPRLLYRPGDQEPCWGVMVDTLRVESAGEEAAALADGWSLSPVPAEPEPKRAKPRLVEGEAS
jgi:hypothetical protein